MFYTQSEKTVKKYTPSFALAQAKAVLNGQNACINAMAQYSDTELLTAVEIDELVNTIVSDSHYHNQTF